MTRILVAAALVLGACGVEGEGLESDPGERMKGEKGEQVVVVTNHADECGGADQCVLIQEDEGTCEDREALPIQQGALSADCIVEDCNDCHRLCNPCLCASIF